MRKPVVDRPSNTSGCGRRGGGLGGWALIQELATKLAKLHLVRRADVLRVILKARALEILHGIELAILRVDLAELFRDREAKRR